MDYREKLNTQIVSAFERELKSTQEYLCIKYGVTLELISQYVPLNLDGLPITNELKTVYIKLLCVPAEKRSKGIGKKVMYELFAWAKRRNCYLYLHTASRKNRYAIGTTSRKDVERFYRRLGFKTWGITENMMLWNGK